MTTPNASEDFDLTLDPAELTMGDLMDFEEKTGTSFEDIGGETRDPKTGAKIKRKPSALQLTALVWISKRRSTPSFSFEDARNLKISGFTTAKAEEIAANPLG